MHTADIALLIDYNFWATHKILDQAAHLTDGQLTEMQPAGFSLGSFKKTLVHFMGAEWIWRMRCQHGVSPKALLVDIDFPTLALIAQRWAEEEREVRAYVASIFDEQLPRVVHYNALNGESRQHTLEHILTHLVFHGMQHRSECAVLLTNYGISPGNIDLIYYMVEKGMP